MTFLELATSCLIDKSDDTGTRSEDPQGSMTRFGEGVVLVETFAAQYDVSPWPCNGADPLDAFADVAARGQDRISLERAQCGGEGNDEWLGQSSSKLFSRGE